MSLMESDGPPPVVRCRFSKEFRADAVVLVLDGIGRLLRWRVISGWVRALLRTGFARLASTAANARGSPLVNARSLLG